MQLLENELNRQNGRLKTPKTAFLDQNISKHTKNLKSEKLNTSIYFSLFPQGRRPGRSPIHFQSTLGVFPVMYSVADVLNVTPGPQELSQMAVTTACCSDDTVGGANEGPFFFWSTLPGPFFFWSTWPTPFFGRKGPLATRKKKNIYGNIFFVFLTEAQFST